MKLFRRQFRKAAVKLIDFVAASGAFQKQAAIYARNYVYRKIVEEDTLYTRSIRLARYTIVSNLISALERALTNNRISPRVRRKLVDILIGKVFLERTEARRDAFMHEFGQEPPGFLTISPGKKCNLHCTGCYAASAAKSSEKLDYATVDRIVSEERQLWAASFLVVSGGEPLLWRSDGKGILDLCRSHPQTYFLMYTNGTLINKETARKIAEVGNLTPAISVEGFEAETDERRGAGVFAKVLQAMANLREVGVPFGVSVTATRNNVETILSDEFIDYFFEQQGAIYGWMFQYMPIGRHHTLDLMVTPEQRLWMFERERQLLEGRHLFLPDFWNGGAYAEGCLAAGRAGGYLHIEWNGNVTPCVFYPYSKETIGEIYARGGTLNDALTSDLMRGIRKWQLDYGYKRTGSEVKNFIAPCSIRDHYQFTRDHVEATGARPIDEDAAEALNDPLYHDGMVAYDEEFLSLTDPIWKREFIDCGPASGNGSRPANGRKARLADGEHRYAAGVGRGAGE